MTIKLRTLVFFLVVLAVVLFAALNWGRFSEPEPLNVLFGTVVAPLGVVMLIALAGLTFLYLLLLGKVETETLLRSRKSDREVEEARKLALDAEQSRFTALREEIRQELGSIDDKVAELLRRVDEQGRIAVRNETRVVPEPPLRGGGDT